jgi:hypothetical protein
MTLAGVGIRFAIAALRALTTLSHTTSSDAA